MYGTKQFVEESLRYRIGTDGLPPDVDPKKLTDKLIELNIPLQSPEDGTYNWFAGSFPKQVRTYDKRYLFDLEAVCGGAYNLIIKPDCISLLSN